MKGPNLYAVCVYEFMYACMRNYMCACELEV